MSKETTCIMTTTKESANLLALATSIYINYFGCTPSINAYEKEIECIEEDLKYLYDNMANRAYAREKERPIWNSCRSIDEIESTTENTSELYMVKIIMQYESEDFDFDTEETRICSSFECAERILKEYMHNEDIFNDDNKLKFLQVEIYDTKWEDGELFERYPIMKYENTECINVNSGNLYRTVCVTTEYCGEQYIYADSSDEKILDYIKTGKTVKIWHEFDDVIVYQIKDNLNTFYTGVEKGKKAPKETK